MTDDDGDHWVFIAGRSDVSIAAVINRDLLLAVADEVTVLSGKQPCVERPVKASLAHSEKSLDRWEAGFYVRIACRSCCQGNRTRPTAWLNNVSGCLI